MGGIVSIGVYAFQPGPGCLATVFTEVAGHIELTPLFTDQTGDTAGPNPLPVDESGWIRVFAASGEYSMRVDQRSLPGALFNIGLDGPIAISVA